MKIKLLVLTLISVLSASAAVAENRAGSVTVSALGGYYHFSNQHHMQNTGVPNVAVAYNLTERWALEGSVGVINTNQTPSYGGDGVHGMLYMIDGVYRFVEHPHWQPYLTAGIGVLGLKPNGNNPTQTGNINAGVGAQLFLDKMLAFRAEARDIYTTTGSSMNDYMLSLGMSVQV